MKSIWIVLGVVGLLIVVLLVIGGSYIGAKNALVQKNEAVNQTFSQVNVVQQVGGPEGPVELSPVVPQNRLPKKGMHHRMLLSS